MGKDNIGNNDEKFRDDSSDSKASNQHKVTTTQTKIPFDPDQLMEQGEMVSVGGASGSMQAKWKNEFGKVKRGQLKLPIKHQSMKRQVLANYKDNENLAEYIASHVAQEFLPPSSTGLLRVPNVEIAYSNTVKGAVVLSKYLEECEDDLSKVIKRGRNKNLNHISFKPRQQITNDNTTYSIGSDSDKDKKLRTEIADIVVISMEVGDHDPNLGNLMLLKDGSIGRIDYGHSYDNMIGPSSFFSGVGGLQHKNSIIDYLNRETLTPHVGFSSKLWKSYDGLTTSNELADSLERVGNDQNYVEKVHNGLKEPKETLRKMIDDLTAHGKTSEIKDITDGLLQINTNIRGKEIDKNATSTEIIDKVFDNIGEYHINKQQEMREASKIIKLQNNINEIIKKQVSGEISNDQAQQNMDKLKQIFSNDPDIKKDNDNQITWIKEEGSSPAFTGTIEQYVQHKSKEVSNAQLYNDVNEYLFSTASVPVPRAIHSNDKTIEETVGHNIITSIENYVKSAVENKSTDNNIEKNTKELYNSVLQGFQEVYSHPTSKDSNDITNKIKESPEFEQHIKETINVINNKDISDEKKSENIRIRIGMLTHLIPGLKPGNTLEREIGNKEYFDRVDALHEAIQDTPNNDRLLRNNQNINNNKTHHK